MAQNQVGIERHFYTEHLPSQITDKLFRFSDNESIDIFATRLLQKNNINVIHFEYPNGPCAYDLITLFNESGTLTDHLSTEFCDCNECECKGERIELMDNMIEHVYRQWHGYCPERDDLIDATTYSYYLWNEQGVLTKHNIDNSIYAPNGENILFSFLTANRKILCVSEKAKDTIIYRFGTPDKIELEFGGNDICTTNFQHESNYNNHSGEITNSLSFTSSNYLYSVYDNITHKNDRSVGVQVKNKNTSKTTTIEGLINSAKGSLKELEIMWLDSNLQASIKQLSDRCTNLTSNWIQLSDIADLSRDNIQSWLPDKGIRGRYEIAKTELSLLIVEQLVGEKVFIAGPHDKFINYKCQNDFGRYNPVFLSKLHKMLSLLFKNKEFVAATEGFYNQELKEYLRTYYATYPHAVNQGKIIEGYLESIKKNEKYSRCGYFLGEPSLYLQESFRSLSDNMDYDFYESVTCPGFWIRRSIDGTVDEFYYLLELMINTFDPKFITEP